MWAHFRHLHFDSFPMIYKTPQCKVFWPLQLNSEILGVPKDSQVPILRMWISSSHFRQVGLRHMWNTLKDFHLGSLWNSNSLFHAKAIISFMYNPLFHLYKTFHFFWLSLQILRHFFRPKSFDNLEKPLTYKQTSLLRTFGGIRFISTTTITPTTY